MATLPPPKTPAQIRAEAQALVDALLSPERAGIESQQADAAAANAAAGQNIQAASEGLAKVLGGIAPQIQQTYSAAAQDTAAFGKGFSDGLKLVEQGSVSGANNTLGKIGAPEGQMLKATGATADVAYGLGGYFPASNLSREGAAFTAAAEFLPATALMRGQLDSAANTAKGAAEQRKFEQFLRDVDAKRPGLLLQIVNQLNDDELQKFAANLQAQYLQLSIGKAVGTVGGKPTVEAKSLAQRQKEKAQKAKAAKSDKKGKAWDNFTGGVYGKAEQMYQGQEIPNPKYGYGPGQDPSAPKTIVKRKSRTEAFNYLWGVYAASLLRQGWTRQQIRAEINKALSSAGYTTNAASGAASVGAAVGAALQSGS